MTEYPDYVEPEVEEVEVVEPQVPEEEHEETQAEEDARVNAEIQTAKVVPSVPVPGGFPESVVHDSRGNVRAEVSDLGIGTVTADDVIKSGRFTFEEREDGYYDIYNLDGTLVVVGAKFQDLENYK